MSLFVETLSWQNGAVRNLPFHEARLNATLQHFWTGVPWLNLAPYIPQIPCSATQQKVRVLYGRNGVEEASYAPYVRRSIHSLRVVVSDTIDYSFKSTNRAALEQLLAQREGCDEVLIVRHGLVTDTSFTNVALFDGEAWYTPVEPLLKGTMRASLIAEGKLRERVIRQQDLVSFQKIMLLNALNGWEELTLPITAIEGIVL